jgi:hypothetical protein
MTRHPPEFQDTDPAVMEAWIELLGKKTPGEKLALTFAFTDLAMKLARVREGLRRPRGESITRTVCWSDCSPNS